MKDAELSLGVVPIPVRVLTRGRNKFTDALKPALRFILANHMFDLRREICAAHNIPVRLDADEGGANFKSSVGAHCLWGLRFWWALIVLFITET